MIETAPRTGNVAMEISHESQDLPASSGEYT